MPEIIWKQGAENDLVQIFADLEDLLQAPARSWFTALT